MSGPVVHFSRKYHFAAAHRLHVDSLTPEENRATFGKCNNPFGHGHNYVVQVTFKGPVDAATGMVTNLATLDAYAKREFLDLFDHSNLNTLECFRDLVPSTENLSVELWRIFAGYPEATLERVHVEETGNNSFDYFGGSAASRIDGRHWNCKHGEHGVTETHGEMQKQIPFEDDNKKSKSKS